MEEEERGGAAGSSQQHVRLANPSTGLEIVKKKKERNIDDIREYAASASSSAELVCEENIALPCNNRFTSLTQWNLSHLSDDLKQQDWLLSVSKVSKKDREAAEAARKLETIRRMKRMSYSCTLRLYIPPTSGWVTNNLIRKAMEVTVSQITLSAATITSVFTHKVLKDVPIVGKDATPGESVFVRPGQPKDSARINAIEYEHGFKIRADRGKNRGSLGFWRALIPEQLLQLIVPDKELHEAVNLGNKSETVANKNGAILNFPGWLIWRFFRRVMTKRDRSARDLLELTPPWKPKMLWLFGHDLVMYHDYAVSYAGKMVSAVSRWWKLYPKGLISVDGHDEAATWGWNADAPAKQLGTLAKRYDVTKARPLSDVSSRWEKLNAVQKTLLNVWMQLGCRWDSFSMIRLAHFMILPAASSEKHPIPTEGVEVALKDWDFRLRINTLCYVLIEKEKVTSHEGRWVPFECNCVSKDDNSTRRPSSIKGTDGFYRLRCKEVLELINSDFCLYHGKYGFQRLVEEVKLPILKSEATRLVKEVGLSMHGPRRTLALWMAAALFRQLRRASIKLFLVDMGWGSVQMLKEYAPPKEVVVTERLDLYPNHQKLFASMRLPKNFKPEQASESNGWKKAKISANSTSKKALKALREQQEETLIANGENPTSGTENSRVSLDKTESLRGTTKQAQPNTISSKESDSHVKGRVLSAKLDAAMEKMHRKFLAPQPAKKTDEVIKTGQKSSSSSSGWLGHKSKLYHAIQARKRGVEEEKRKEKEREEESDAESEDSVVIHSDSGSDRTWKEEDLSSDEDQDWGENI